MFSREPGRSARRLPDPAALVPRRYTAYRPLVSEAFEFFLARLPSRRVAEIATEQLALPARVTVAERVVALMRRCPTLHKLGQVVARDRRLARELRQQLQKLESTAPGVPAEAVIRLVRREVGTAPGVEFGKRPLAEGSVAVAMPFRWHEQGRRRDGVFKVLKPGIETRLHQELEILVRMGPFLEERCRAHGLPPLDYSGAFRSVRDLLLNEVRLEEEQANMAAARRFYADDSRVLVPRLLPFCTQRVTAMDRVLGAPIATRTGGGEARETGELIVETLVARPFWSPGASATFHADPHGGNLFLTPEGRLAILDWSLVVRLGKDQREAVIQLALAAFALDGDRLERVLVALMGTPPPGRELREAVEGALGEVVRGGLPGLRWTLDLLDRLATGAGAGFPRELVLFRKALLTLTNLVADLGAEGVEDEVMIRTGLRRFLSELPLRALAPPWSRDFGARVSSLDLAGLWAAWPWAAARWWERAGYAGLWGTNPSAGSARNLR